MYHPVYNRGEASDILPPPYVMQSEQYLINNYDTYTHHQMSSPKSTVLVFGETGSGKSTWINMMTNYFLDGSLDKLHVSIPTKHFKATEKFKAPPPQKAEMDAILKKIKESRELDMYDPDQWVYEILNKNPRKLFKLMFFVFRNRNPRLANIVSLR